MMTQTSKAEALDLHKSSQGEKTNIVQFFTVMDGNGPKIQETWHKIGPMQFRDFKMFHLTN